MATDNLVTGISVTGDAQQFIKAIDKMVNTMDNAANKIDERMNDIQKSGDKLTETQKRMVDSMKQSTAKLTDEYKRLSTQYEQLVQAIQKKGTATEDDIKKLYELRNQIRACKADMYELERDTYNMAKGLGVLGKAAKESAENLEQIAESTRIMMGLKAGQILANFSSELFNFGKQCVYANERLNQIRKALEVATGSVEAAEVAYTQLLRISDVTPFNVQEVITIGKGMLMMGKSIDETREAIYRYGDAAAALGTDIGRVSKAMQALQSSSKVNAGVLNEITATGVNAYKILAEKFGVTMGDIRTMARKGTLDVQESFKAIYDYMARFEGQMDKLDKTLTGSLDAMHETWINNFLPAIGKALDASFDLTGRMREVRLAIDDIYLGFEKGLQETNSLQGAMEGAFGKPVVLAVEGLAAAVGVTLVLAVVGATKAWFGYIAQQVIANKEMVKTAYNNIKLAAQWVANNIAMKQTVAQWTMVNGQMQMTALYTKGLVLSTGALVAGVLALAAAMYAGYENGKQLEEALQGVSYQAETTAELTEKLRVSISMGDEAEETAQALKHVSGVTRDLDADLREATESVNGMKDVIDTYINQLDSELNPALEEVQENQEALNRTYMNSNDSLKKYKEECERLAGVLPEDSEMCNQLRENLEQLNQDFADGTITVAQYVRQMAAWAKEAGKVQQSLGGVFTDTNMARIGEEMEARQREIEKASGVTVSEIEKAEQAEEEAWLALNKGTEEAKGGGSTATGKGGKGAKDKAFQNEMKNLKELNKLEEDRLARQHKLQELQFQTASDPYRIQIQNALKYGTDTEKIEAQIKQIALDRIQKVAAETNRYQEQELQMKHQLAEAEKAFNHESDAKQKEILKQRINGMREQQELQQTIHESNLAAIEREKEAKMEAVAEERANNLIKYTESNAYEEQLIELQNQRREAAKAGDVAEVEALNTKIELTQKWQSIEQSAMNIMSDSIYDLITGAKSAQEVMKNLFESVLKQALQMYTQMFLKQTLFRNLQTKASEAELTEVQIQAEAAMASAEAQNAIVQATVQADAALIGSAYATAAMTRAIAELGPVAGPAAYTAALSEAVSMSAVNAGLAFATGGMVQGPGGPTSDIIPALLSNGEYVLNARAVQAIGPEVLDALNSGAPKYARRSSGGSMSSAIAVQTVGMSDGDDSPFVNAGIGNTSISISAIDARSFQKFLEHGGADRIAQVTKNRQRQFNSTSGQW